MIPEQLPDLALSNLLRKIVLSPNPQVLKKVFDDFQGRFPQDFPFAQIQITPELTQRFLLARSKLSSMQEALQPLQDLMQRLQECFNKSLQINPVLSSHLQDILGDDVFTDSCINNFLSAVNASFQRITYSDLFALLGSDWGGFVGNAINVANIDSLCAIKAFCSIINASISLNAGTQSGLWKQRGLHLYAEILIALLYKANEGKLHPPAAEDLEILKTSQITLYLPIGYANDLFFFMSLVAIDYTDQGYRLRLLASDNTMILPPASKLHHYCPEVIWEGLQIDQLLQESLWKPLLEAATLKIEEQQSIDHFENLAFNATHLVPWITQKLGKNPFSTHVEISDENWQATLDKLFGFPHIISLKQEVQKTDNPVSSQELGNFLLKPTGKEIKRTASGLNLRKFVNLLPSDLLKSQKEMLLFKAESRLLLLTAAYKTLHEKTSPTMLRGQFLRLIEQSWGKITAPIEKLMQLDPSQHEKKSAQILLVSMLDLKHRLTTLIQSSDQISLTPAKPLYPSTHAPYKLTCTGIPAFVMKHTILDTLRLNTDTPMLPYHEQWTQERAATLHSLLESWYNVLLEAKNACEPVELIALAHRNIFSKLPIPSTDKVEATFPEPLSEGLQVGILLLLKKICSLVASEAYLGSFVPPCFVADMTRVYRFSIELYRHINPDVSKLAISWFCLHQYLQSRHSYHTPGEVRATLEALEKSFTCISPNGHLRPSEDFKKIPLFYFSWDEFPMQYTFYRKDLGPVSLFHRSVEEILSIAELADTAGLKIEEIDQDRLRWANSFGGQCVLLLEQIAQYYTMSTFVTPDVYRKALRQKSYRENELFEHLGPEDHFQVTPPDAHKTYILKNQFGKGKSKYYKLVIAGQTPMSHRMVSFNDTQVSEPVSNSPIIRVDAWREQADLLKALPKQISLMAKVYPMHQAASGPSSLSLDQLLEYFEARPALLLNKDYRSFFFAVIHSANVMESACTCEPLLLARFKAFINALCIEDRQNLSKSNLNLERMLWLSELLRLLCLLGPQAQQMFCPLLAEIVHTLQSFGHEQTVEGRLAPHLLASQKYLPQNFKLSVLQLARLHLVMGCNSPHDPNDTHVWLEAAEAMQAEAPRIMQALLSANESTRRALWALIFSSEADIAKALKRKPQNISLATLAKTSAQIKRLELKQAYLERWRSRFTTNPPTMLLFRGHAIVPLLQKVNEELCLITKARDSEASELFTLNNLFVTGSTNFVIRMNGCTITVDWQTGRIMGATSLLPRGKRLPAHIRKHPDLALLGDLLHRPLVIQPLSNWVHFQDFEALRLDMSTGKALLHHNKRIFCLVSSAHYHCIKLPDQLKDGFSIWLNETEDEEWYGILVAHAPDGTPHPAFAIDPSGVIRPLQGNTRLRLASTRYCSEAQLFFRWGLAQNDILVWLDDDANVAELHLPLCNGSNYFTRVFRTTSGGWKIEGVELELEAAQEAVAAFAGHPVYLVGKNSKKERLLLLPSNTPYEIKKQLQKVQWNHIFACGAKESIYQYRILPSGQVEGLTVAENLLLMLWSLEMGQYSTCAELAKRWLTPPGRPYTDDEERLLSTWVHYDLENYSISNECHPSALSLRLYVLVRITRHLRNFPQKRASRKAPGRVQGKVQEKKMSILESALAGPYYDSHKNPRMILEKMMEEFLNPLVLKRQMKGTNFEELISTYDHEAALRLLDRYYLEKDTPLSRQLYLRLNKKHAVAPLQDLLPTTITACQIHGKKVLNAAKTWDGHYALENLITVYSSVVQTDKVDIDQIMRRLIQTQLLFFFNKAYTLIKQGVRTTAEELEYNALMHAFKELRGSKALDLCLQYVSQKTGAMLFRDMFSHENLLLWLILEQAYFAKTAGKELPELPSIKNRFGLVLQESKSASEAFFKQLISLSGKDANGLMDDYRQEWFNKRSMGYLLQYKKDFKTPDSFKQSLITPWPQQLTSEIHRWRQLPSSMLAKPKIEGVRLRWNYPIPQTWNTTLDLVLNLQPKLHERLKHLSEIAAKRKKELLTLANALPTDENLKLFEFARQIHYAAPLSIDDCINRALTGDTKLQLETLLYLEAALEEAHLMRAKKELELYQNDPNNKELAQQFLDTLTTQHHYELSTENLPLMISEYYSDCRLRAKPNQAHLIEILTSDSTKGSIIQAIMGSGKSKMLAPIWLQIMLVRGRLPILCVPNSLFRTTLTDLQDIMWKRFRTHVRALTFDRESSTSDTLHALAETLHIAKLEPTVFVCTPRDLHALQLMLKERHQVIEEMRERLQRFTLQWSEAYLNKAQQERLRAALSKEDWHQAELEIPEGMREGFNQWKTSHEKLEEELKQIMAEANILQAILNLLQHEAALLVDEVATCYDPRNLLSFPIGWQVPANPHAVAIGCKIYFEWLIPHFNELHLLNNMQSLSTATIREQIYRNIAKKAWEEYRELVFDLPPLEPFTDYLLSISNKSRDIHAFIMQLNTKSGQEKQIAQEIAFLKYCLTCGLEGAFTSIGHVQYGRSKQDPHLYIAIPYQCANVPKEDTLFRRPWKTILMTCQMYCQEWKDVKQTAELIGFLQGIDPQSKDKKILDAAFCIWGRRYSDVDFSNHKEMQELTSLLDLARLDQKSCQAAYLLIRSYLQSCVFPSQLKLDPSQLTSSPQDIPMIAAKADAMGGTFGFERTWNPKLQRFADQSTDATILNALTEARNQRCHIIPKGGAEAFIAHLKTGALSGYMALIDAGAYFKGLSNAVVAKRLLDVFKGFGSAKHSDFDCVLFYDEEQSGTACLAVMSAHGKTLLESSDRDGVRRALSQLRLFTPFTYYDQARCIGADLELKDGRALITFSDTVTKDDLIQSAMRCRHLLDGRHCIAYAIFEEMGHDWNSSKVIEASKQHQKQVEEKANFHGICEQLRAEARAVIDKTMRVTSDPEQRHQIHKRAKAFFMEEQSNDLVKTFGYVQGRLPTIEALHRLVDELINGIEKILPECKQEIIIALKSILNWHNARGTVLPEWVREGDEQDDAVQEVDLSKDQDRLRLMEDEYERMLGTRNPKKEIAWSHFDPQLITASPLGFAPDAGQMPRLYRLEEALKERGFLLPLASNLLISANLLTTFVGQTNCLLTETQKPIHRGLFLKGAKEPLLVLVSEGDARQLKEHLLSLPDQKGQGIYLLEPSGAINQRGWRGEQVVNLWQEGLPKERILLLQALFFQGSALTLDRLSADEVTSIFNLWTQQDPNRVKAVRILFEAALNLRPDDMLHYHSSQKLRTLFTKTF